MRICRVNQGKRQREETHHEEKEGIQPLTETAASFFGTAILSSFIHFILFYFIFVASMVANISLVMCYCIQFLPGEPIRQVNPRGHIQEISLMPSYKKVHGI